MINSDISNKANMVTCLPVNLNNLETTDRIINISFTNCGKNLHKLIERALSRCPEPITDQQVINYIVKTTAHRLVSGDFATWETYESDLGKFNMYVYKGSDCDDEAPVCNAIITREWIEEFIKDRDSGDLKKLIKFNGTAKSNDYTSAICFNFNCSHLIKLKGLEDVDPCDYILFTVKYYVLATFLVIYGEIREYLTTEKSQNNFNELFVSFLFYTIITGYTGIVEYKLNGCKYVDLYNELKQLLSEDNNVISYLSHNDYKKSLDITIKNNDFIIADYEATYNSYTSNYLRKKYDKAKTDTKAIIQIRHGSSLDKMLVQTTLTGGDLIGRLFRFDNKAKPIPMPQIYLYAIPCVKDAFTFYLMCVLDKTELKNNPKFKTLSVLQDYVKEQTAQKNVVLNTLTEYVLAQLPSDEVNSVVAPVFKDRYRDKNKLIRNVEALKKRLDSKRYEKSLVAQLITELRWKFVW